MIRNTHRLIAAGVITATLAAGSALGQFQQMCIRDRYSDALSGVNGPAATYLDMMRHNAKTIAAALK